VSTTHVDSNTQYWLSILEQRRILNTCWTQTFRFISSWKLKPSTNQLSSLAPLCLQLTLNSTLGFLLTSTGSAARQTRLSLKYMWRHICALRNISFHQTRLTVHINQTQLPVTTPFHGKSYPIRGLRGSRRLRLPNFETIGLYPPPTPGNIPGNQFC
jgi:hypothetical protein